MMKYEAYRQSRGFTLIELMIVVAIIGIIGAIAYPSYDSYMKKSRRADAKVGLAKVADRQERFYLNNGTYTSDMTNLGFTPPFQTENGYYQLSITSATASGFTASATALGAQTNDTNTTAGDCTAMTLDSTGLKTPAACW